MANEKIVEVLNKARADELMAILQYMGHHYEAEGMESPAIMDMFKETSIDEMKHAEKLAERIVYLGGTPTYQPSAMKKGGDLKKMVRDDLEAENSAIANYKKFIKICADEGDSTSRLMLEEILSQEEEHADNWETILGVRK
ncbi:MAG: ferritin-like domain-containing protein [Thermodesulfobacteriota bacterium]